MEFMALLQGRLTAPVVLSKLGAMVGLNAEAAGKGVGAALPVLLGALGHVAETPEGAARLDDAVVQADDSILGSLDNALSGGGASSLMGAGNVALSGLLGGSLVGGAVSAIVRFTGLGNSAVSGLLGLLAPIVLGVLKDQKKSLGLDAAGLARMLAGQKSQIAAAMPPGLGSLLGTIPGTNWFSDSNTQASRTTPGLLSNREDRMTAPHNPVPSNPAPHNPQPASPMRWLLPLLLLAGLGLLLWSFLGREKATPQADLTTSGSAVIEKSVVPQMQAAGAAAGPVAATASTWFKDVTTTVTGITDEATANAALPRLTELAGGLPQLKTAVDGLPAEVKPGVVSTIKAEAEKLMPLLDKASAMPGVGPVIKPAVDQIRTGLAAIS